MGRRVYLSNEDLEAYEVLRGLFQISLEAGGIFAPEGDEKEHNRICEIVSKLSVKIDGTNA